MAGLILVSLLGTMPVAGSAEEPAGLAVKLVPSAPDSKLAPRFSPKGTQIKLVPRTEKNLPGIDHLEGRISLGPAMSGAPEGQLFVVARSEKGKPYDLLILDTDHNGSLEGEARISTTPSTTRDKIWSTFAATPKVNHAPKGSLPSWEEYPVSFWIVVEKADESPALIRFSRRGFLTGTVSIEGKPHDVMLADGDNNGVLGNSGDSWVLRPAAATAFTADESRSVGDYAWAGGKAWKLTVDGSAGRNGRLVPFDPGVTQEDDAIRRDRLREDRMAPRAAKPVAFRDDADAAIKEAIEKKRPYFIKFETDWCVPCKQMHALVFTAKSVAEAADGVLCITVDGDKRKDLVKTHRVSGYPTGVLFGADGSEAARFSGYQSVKQTTDFFQKLKK